MGWDLCIYSCYTHSMQCPRRLHSCCLPFWALLDCFFACFQIHFGTYYFTTKVVSDTPWTFHLYVKNTVHLWPSRYDPAPQMSELSDQLKWPNCNEENQQLVNSWDFIPRSRSSVPRGLTEGSFCLRTKDTATSETPQHTRGPQPWNWRQSRSKVLAKNNRYGQEQPGGSPANTTV